MRVLEAIEPYLGIPLGESEGNYKFQCPFRASGTHRHPAFYIHGETGLAFCHSCNTGWNLPQLLRALGARGSVIDAVANLLDDRPKKKRRAVPQTEALPEALLGVFQHCPTSLLEAGFEMELLRQWEIGYDLNHRRPTYPIRDHLGRLVGVMGRNERGYWLYGPEEYKKFLDVYPRRRPNKSDYLWGLHKFYAIRFAGKQEEPFVLVEGFKACLWTIQSGFPHTAALMGSYLSEMQARLVERITGQVYLFLDQDDAGLRGCQRAIKRLHTSCDVRIVPYPRRGKLQPDDLTTDEVASALEAARPHYRRSDEQLPEDDAEEQDDWASEESVEGELS